MIRHMEKYVEFLGTGYPLGSRIVIRVTPRSISYWKGTEFYKLKKPRKYLLKGKSSNFGFPLSHDIEYR